MPVFNAVIGLMVVALFSGAPKEEGEPRVALRVTLHTVHLIGYTYEPADLVVQVGDTVRFVQESTLPHNVEFTDVPAGTTLGDAMSGPYVIQSGDLYDLVINERFRGGDYAFHCTPHQTLGMKGTLKIQ